MRIINSEFIVSAVKQTQYPKDDLPQIVLVGKSNVGKSSFINTLANRKKLARTSSVPGKTRLINFYNISGEYDECRGNFYFVDLPGYGFSKMSKAEQVKVGEFIEEYLKKSKNISLIVFLIDIRHSPTSDDRLMYNYIIKQNLPCIVICNKADKIAITKVDNQVASLQNELNPLKDIKFLPFSMERKIYTQSVLDEISKFL
jgi:GTP-binding protein